MVAIAGGCLTGPKPPLPGSRGVPKTEEETRTYGEATLLVPTRRGRLGGGLVGRRGAPMGVLRRREDERDLFPTYRKLPRMRQGVRPRAHAFAASHAAVARGA